VLQFVAKLSFISHSLLALFVRAELSTIQPHRHGTDAMNTQGVHLICELSGCSNAALSDVAAVRAAMEAAAARANVAVLDGYFHTFAPSGVTGLLCLSESHFSIHTWPESGYAPPTCTVRKQRSTARSIAGTRVVGAARADSRIEARYGGGAAFCSWDAETLNKKAPRSDAGRVHRAINRMAYMGFPTTGDRAACRS
jgi:S-adenosylmethionine decarboxylase